VLPPSRSPCFALDIAGNTIVAGLAFRHIAPDTPPVARDTGHPRTFPSALLVVSCPGHDGDADGYWKGEEVGY
jgi:hypothetical protein